MKIGGLFREFFNQYNMADITKDFVSYRIDSKAALYSLRLSSPGTYDKVMKLREDYPTLMNLPVERLIPLMRKAVESLIEEGVCKRRVNPETLDEMWREQEERKKRFREEKKMKTVKQ